jgi:hypothetical protein
MAEKKRKKDKKSEAKYVYYFGAEMLTDAQI